MSADIPLTALCAICHTAAPKYTCPRCGIHTCSLPCVKLHKKRASCSGIRDPTAYRRRADLATASSIDSDFNFITSLERSLSRAEEIHHNTTTTPHLQAAGLNQPRSRQTDSARLERLVSERQVLWRRAPRGMRRRQLNETRIEHSGVTWSAEFVFADGTRRMCALPESHAIGEAVEKVTRPQQPAKQLGKRKRGAAGANGKRGQVKDAKGHFSTQDEEHKSQYGEPVAAVVQTNSEPQHDYADQHFYIHRPNTPSRFKVLAPVSRSDTLQTILKGRVVMEFPTFYIKAEPPDALILPFMTEERYLQENGEDVIPLARSTLNTATDEEEDGEISEANPGLKENAEDVLHALADPSQVMSVLKQDLVTS
jgi:hypothetical protein